MGARILAIDDNAPNLELMLYLLRAFGHAADGASDGFAGVAAAKEGAYDLILSDIQMPGMDGYGVAREVAACGCRTPLIAVTAFAMVGDRDRLLAAGFDGYISKPIDPETFVQRVDAALPERLRSSGRPV